jgi:hypothetical protein
LGYFDPSFRHHIRETNGQEGKTVNKTDLASAYGGFEVLFRFYGPEKALFEKSWVLPEIEQAAVEQARDAA